MHVSYNDKDQLPVTTFHYIHQGQETRNQNSFCKYNKAIPRQKTIDRATLSLNLSFLKLHNFCLIESVHIRLLFAF